MKLKGIILAVLLISTGIIEAQTDFRPGYVIRKSGDTIFGQIDYRGDLLMGRLCKFMDKNSLITEFSPGDIAAFRFVDSKYYVSSEIGDKKAFLEYLIKGKVSIYYLRDEEGDHYYIDKEEARLVEIPYEEGIKEVNNKKIYYESTRHTGFLQYYMKDAPELQSRIQSIKKPEHKNLIRLAEDYHNAVCEGEKCIVFEMKQPLLKVNLEGLAGVVNFENVEDLNDKFYFQGGIIAHFWMPGMNEKIFFKTGFLYSQPEQQGKKKAYFKVPTHLGYIAPKSFRVRPSVSIGLLSPSYSGGIAVQVHKKIYMGIQSWINFFPNERFFLIPDELYNYSFSGSIYIEL